MRNLSILILCAAILVLVGRINRQGSEVKRQASQIVELQKMTFDIARDEKTLDCPNPPNFPRQEALRNLKNPREQ